MDKNFSIGVSGIIFDKQNRVLLCHRRDRDFWNLPGGGLEKGEFLLNGLKREIMEETGLEIEAIKLVGVYDKPEESDIVFVFACQSTGGEIATNAEADKIEYFSLEDLPKNIIKKHTERIKDAYRNNGFSVIKQQNV